MTINIGDKKLRVKRLVFKVDQGIIRSRHELLRINFGIEVSICAEDVAWFPVYKVFANDKAIGAGFNDMNLAMEHCQEYLEEQIKSMCEVIDE